MLAMNLRALRGVRYPASSLTTLASLLAPTGPWWPGISVSANLVVCRSEHAHDAPENAAACQVPRVIVDDPREHARSYRSVVATDRRPGKPRPL